MSHADDDGMRVPPRLSPKQVIILPVIPKDDQAERVISYCEALAAELKATVSYNGDRLAVHVDKRDIRGGEKSWQWIKKGAPIRIEVGPRDIDQEAVMLYRRDKAHKDKLLVKRAELAAMLPGVLDEIQATYFAQAKATMEAHTRDDLRSFDEFKAFFTPKNPEKPEIHGGFVRAAWCEDPETLPLLEELKVTIRCKLLEQRGGTGSCILTGKPATNEYIFAKSY